MGIQRRQREGRLFASETVASVAWFWSDSCVIPESRKCSGLPEPHLELE